MFRFSKFWWKYSEPPRPVPEHLQRPPDPWPLSSVVMSYSDYDFHTIGDDMSNAVVLGGNGAGKTTAVARLQRLARLYLGYGVVFFTSKKTDVGDLLKLIEIAGRLNDVVLIGPESGHQFNFMDYIMRRYLGGAVEEAVNTLLTCSEVLNRGNGSGSGGEHGSFFENAMKRQLRAVISVISKAGEPVTIAKIMKVIRTAPTSMEQVRSDAFRAEAYCMHTLMKADAAPKTAIEKRDFEEDMDYLLDEYPKMSDRTRSSVNSTVSGITDPLLRGDTRELLCSGTTFEPDWLFERGSIFINTMSTKEYGISGVLCQTIMKYMIQKAIDRRDVMQFPRPVSLDIDEFHLLANSYDSIFAATCRSQRAGMFLLSQNLPTIYAALGSGDKAKQEVDSLLGNCAAKFFCANSCSVTNQWAADLIGKCKQFMINANSSSGDDDASSILFGGGSDRMSAGVNEVMDYELQPAFFSQGLRTGGPSNDWCVDAIAFRNGKKFRNGKTWMPVVFDQK